MALIYLSLVAIFLAPSTYSMTKNERSELRETVKDMFRHAYDSYMTYAYPADELMPLNCKGRYRDTEPSRGDVDDILGNFSMTLIDSLDSLVIFGEVNKFEEAVKLVIEEVNFDNDIVVSTFETNIRVLGGLLGGHVAADVLKNSDIAMYWYNDELLDMAKDIGERLMPAFNTTTGIPYPKVNLKYGVADPRSRTGTESATCTACAGTMIMEFGALSRLTGDPKFETVAHKAMKALWTYRSRSSDLVGTVINIHNGEWVRRDSGVGAGIDSYYEYCLKAYILLGEEDYLQRFNQHYKAVMRYINRDSLFLNVHMNNPDKRSVTYMDSLQAFWPGLQVLKGDLKSAIELHEVFYSVAKRHTFLPEAFTTSFEVHWGQHFLRPELVESTYFLYEATKDPYYLEVGKYIVENLNRYTRVPCGFAAVRDVRTLSHENRMDSFLLSETLKYLYLLFTDKEELIIDLHDFVFTTEAHILPLALSNWNGSSSGQNNIYESENLHDHSCPRTARDGSMLSFAEKIRRKSRRSSVDGSCPKTKETQNFAKSKGTSPLLRAEQFIPGNKDHLLILKAMGISVTKTDDGKVQLMQDASSADNTEMAAEGVTFMQSMIELAKFRSNDAEYLPRVVQILSPPYNGHIVLNAGPAQFGIDLGKSGMGVGAEVILADPFKGCTELTNKDAADHRIVVMERGECMFIDKVRVAESFGAVGAIIIDNNEDSSSESQPMFAMSGDGSSSNINIPAVFLFWNEGQVLQKSMQIVSINTGGNLRVRLADKALKKDANKKETVPTSDAAQTAAQEHASSEPKPQFKEEKDHLNTLQNKAETEKLEDTQNEVDKLINIMKNVVNQPGFEFLSQNVQLKSKASVMGEIRSADKRERFLYDAMMKNWQEKGRIEENIKSGSESKEDIVCRKALEAGVAAVNAAKMSSIQAKVTGSYDGVVKEGRPAHETSEEVLNTAAHKDSEVVVIGKVSEGKLSHEEIVYDVTTLQKVAEEREGFHDESERSDRHCKQSKDAVTKETVISSDTLIKASDAPDRDAYTPDGKLDNPKDTHVDNGNIDHVGSPNVDTMEDPNSINSQDDGHISEADNPDDPIQEKGQEDGRDRPEASFVSKKDGECVDEVLKSKDEYEEINNENENSRGKDGERVDEVFKSKDEYEEINNENENSRGEITAENEELKEAKVNSDRTIESAQHVDERTVDRGKGESTDSTLRGGHDEFVNEASDGLHGGETEREIDPQESNNEGEKTFNQRGSHTLNTEKDSEARTVQETSERESEFTNDDEELQQNLNERTLRTSGSETTTNIHDSLIQKDINSENNLHN